MSAGTLKLVSEADYLADSGGAVANPPPSNGNPPVKPPDGVGNPPSANGANGWTGDKKCGFSSLAP